jgi:hypothetical protein
MRTCPKCDAQLRVDARVCPNCRAAQRDGVTPAKLAACFMAFLAAIPIAIALMPLFEPSHRPSRRSECKNALKQIGLALHNYHDAYDSFPPAYIADEHGRPMHSWRVLILPFLDAHDLYTRYDFSVPWNHPHNRYVLEHMPDVFHCPSDESHPEHATNYFAAFGPDCVFNAISPTPIREMTDGTSDTILVGEAVGLNVPWTMPADIDIEQHPRINEPGGFGSAHELGAHFLLGDGSVRYIQETLSEEILRNLFRRNDGNMIPDF